VSYSTQSIGISDPATVISIITNSIFDSGSLNFIDFHDALYDNGIKSIYTFSRPTLVRGSLSLIIYRSARPTGQPSSQPSSSPSSQPSSHPTTPTSSPTSQPTKIHIIDNGSIKVFISFGALLGFIVFITILAEYHHGSTKIIGGKNKEDFKKKEEDFDSDSDDKEFEQKNKSQNDSPRKAFNNVLTGYVKSLFDGVFATSESRKSVIEKEFEENHLYLSILYSRNVGTRRWFKALKLFSSETVAASFICLFYSYQSPRAYTCSDYKTSTSCLSTKSLLDSSKTVCQWKSNTCSINGSSSFYDHVASIIILLVVMQAMGIVNFILEIAINHIICTPAYIEEDDVKRALDRNEVRSQSGKVVQDRMIKMMSSMRTYRKSLLDNSKIEELQYFDDQWGVIETLSENTIRSPRRNRTNDDDESSRMTTSLSSLKKKFNIRDSERIARDMFEIVTLTQEYSFRMQDLHDSDCSLLLLYIFILDLLGRDSPIAKIYAKKVDLFTLHKPKVPLAIKFITFLIILGGDGVAIYYTSMIAANQDTTWNYVVLVCATAYFFFDLIIFETAKLFWIHLLIPSLIAPCILHVEKTILSLLDKTKEIMMEEDEDVKAFNASDYVFVSVATAKLFPQKPESALILTYKNPFPENYRPNSKGFSWEKILSPKYKKQSWETMSLCQVILIILLSSSSSSSLLSNPTI